MAFVPLHNHSDYSLLDGASQISKIVERACDLGMESIALTDHGVMYGVLDLVKKCKEKGIKPKNLKEQISFPQMQERIRNAKDKRREQQKKSEKLYMDTKKKGVKFYDKKGTGRLKDGKKIYD